RAARSALGDKNHLPPRGGGGAEGAGGEKGAEHLPPRGGGGAEGAGGGRTVVETPRKLTMDAVRRILSHGAGPLRSAESLENAHRQLTRTAGATNAAETARRLSCMVIEAALLREE